MSVFEVGIVFSVFTKSRFGIGISEYRDIGIRYFSAFILFKSVWRPVPLVAQSVPKAGCKGTWAPRMGKEGRPRNEAKEGGRKERREGRREGREDELRFMSYA